MTTSITPATASGSGGAATPSPAPVTVAGRATFSHAVRSEWTKFRSLRSSWWTIAVAAILIVGFGALISANTGNGRGPQSDTAAGIAGIGLAGTTFAALALGVLGVLMMSGEYGTGMIRASMTAVPKRLPVLWAKVVVFIAVVLPTMVVSSLVTFWLDDAIRSSRGLPTVSLSDDGALRVVLGAALYLTVAGIIGMAIGLLLRHTAAGLATFVALFFVLPIVTLFLPSSLTGYSPYLPSNAGGSLWGSAMGDASLAPWTGFGYLCLYAVVLLGASAWRLRRSDV